MHVLLSREHRKILCLGTACRLFKFPCLMAMWGGKTWGGGCCWPAELKPVLDELKTSSSGFRDTIKGNNVT